MDFSFKIGSGGIGGKGEKGIFQGVFGGYTAYFCHQKEFVFRTFPEGNTFGKTEIFGPIQRQSLQKRLPLPAHHVGGELFSVHIGKTV